MLPKENRISKIDYPSLLKNSRYFNVDGNTVKFSKIDSGFKVSIIISGKVSKLAVQRNLIKRIFHSKIKEIKINEILEKKALFIYVSKDFGKMKRKEINEKVSDIMSKICLYFQKS